MGVRATSNGTGKRSGHRMASSGGSVWTPASEPPGTFTLWADGADRSSFVAAGGFISQITDKSGAGNHLIQATGSAQPTDLTNGWGITAARFFQTTLPADNNTETAFIVANLVAGGTLLGPAAGGGGRQYRVSTGDLNVLRAGVAQESTMGGALFTYGVVNLAEVQLGNPTVLGVNGVLQTNGAHTVSFAAGTTLIGTKDDGGEDGIGTQNEIIICATKPSADLATRIRTYLRGKWGFP